jgi:hypothetical protein
MRRASFVLASALILSLPPRHNLSYQIRVKGYEKSFLGGAAGPSKPPRFL